MIHFLTNQMHTELISKKIKALDFASSSLIWALRLSLIIAYPKQKLNVSGSQILLGYLIGPKMATFQASIFGYRFRMGLQQKGGSIF